jgi:anti-sigma factor RsiW
MTCGQASEWIGAYHDRELDPAHSIEVEAHLRECPMCAAQLQRLEALRSAIVRHAPYYSAPAGLLPGAAREERWSWRWPLLAAACLVLAVGIWRIAPAAGGGSLAREVATAHVRSLQAEHLLDVPSSDRHTVKPWFAGKLDFAPEVQDLSSAGFTLMGGRLDYLDGRPVAALIYRRRQHTINLFTWPSAAADQASRRGSMSGFNMVHWVRHGMNWWAVSDLSADELAQLAGLL